MKNEPRSALLNELVALDGPWQKKIEYGSGATEVSWLPVAELSSGRFLLGLTFNGGWATSKGAIVQEINDSSTTGFQRQNLSIV